MSHVILFTLVFTCFALKGRRFCYADMDTDSVPGLKARKSSLQILEYKGRSLNWNVTVSSVSAC